MAIFGLGIDLIEVGRIKNAISRFSDRFKNRVFSPEEQEFCESRANKYLAYAARFAAKEAFSKALGTGLRGKILWREIVVIDNEKAPPHLEVRGKAKEILKNRQVFLSLTHTTNYAAAVVIIEE
ncbi:MAG: holo-ACP synthase [candidate division WOR-3 bacterium]|nr:holo-ACP synthase [candidate division WOR-3 bacterium]MCX7757005.1 holo-ACP synthase [candidate division WOR-3 bacterium]MDW7988338.1 holo-ACP synthase [candidate division WOR-3 bacterium]